MFQYSCLPFLAPVEPGGCLDYKSFYLLMVHAHDNHGRGDDHQPPGTGSIDWYRVTATLSEANFHGAIILELAGRLKIDQFSRILDAAQQHQNENNDQKEPESSHRIVTPTGAIGPCRQSAN
jgi:hypothetical protein